MYREGHDPYSRRYGGQQRTLIIFNDCWVIGKSGIAGTTIFHELLNSEILLEREKTVARLWQEGQVVIGAGTETTAWSIVFFSLHLLLGGFFTKAIFLVALSVTVFYLLSNTPVLSKLRQELEATIPDPSTLPPLTRLEQLPYLICPPTAPLTIMPVKLSLTFTPQ